MRRNGIYWWWRGMKRTHETNEFGGYRFNFEAGPPPPPPRKLVIDSRKGLHRRYARLPHLCKRT
jgi:hypothetical protein